MQTRIIHGKRKHSEIQKGDLQRPRYVKNPNEPVKISSTIHSNTNRKIGQQQCGKPNNLWDHFNYGKLESFAKLYEFDDICYNKYQFSDFKIFQEIKA